MKNLIGTSFPVILLIMIACSGGPSGKQNQERDYFAFDSFPWCPFHDDHLKRDKSDSVIVISYDYGFNSGYNTLVIRDSGNGRYNAHYFEADSLTGLYLALDTEPGLKAYFDGMFFKIPDKKVKSITKQIGNLFGRTGPESNQDMLDGTTFYISFLGENKTVNYGPLHDEWKSYSRFLQDSVIRPVKDFREKVRREANARVEKANRQDNNQ